MSDHVLLDALRRAPLCLPQALRSYAEPARERAALAAAACLHPSAKGEGRVKFFMNRVAANLAHAEEALRADSRVACHRGCSACCHFSTLVSAPEILDLVAYFRAVLSPGVLEELSAHVAHIAREVREKTAKQRWEARIPCALLSPQGTCRGYRHRPVICRTYNSGSAEACQTAEPGAGWHRARVDVAAIGTGTSQGIAEGASAAGLDGHPLELSLALDIALSIPDIEARWLAGEDVFSAAWIFPEPCSDVPAPPEAAEGESGAA